MVTFGVVKGAEPETFVAVEIDNGTLKRTWFMTEAELRESVKDAPQADIEATIAGARQHPA